MRSQGEKVVHSDKGINKSFVGVLKEFQEYLTRTQAVLSANPSSMFNLYHEVCYCSTCTGGPLYHHTRDSQIQIYNIPPAPNTAGIGCIVKLI